MSFCQCRDIVTFGRHLRIAVSGICNIKKKIEMQHPNVCEGLFIHIFKERKGKIK